MKQVFIALLLLFSTIGKSQTIITGFVKNKSGKPLSASVTLQTKNSITILAFTSTDNDGFYKLNYKGEADSIKINISGINIGKHTKTVANRTHAVDFNIDEKPLILKEAIVKPPKIRRSGDTISYLVNEFTDQSDRVIGDILRKLPGIEVAVSGRISYNGKPINKFYIENMDLLQGRYGIAVKNISAKDVATVQVLENHEPIKALKDRRFSDDAAINLTLKESAKGTLAITAMAGGGYEPWMWNAELVTMYFAKKRQNINTYKTNNTGDDVTGELRSFYSGASNSAASSLLYIQSPSTPPVSRKRYLLNNAHAVSLNNLFKLSNEYELNVNAIYYNDRQEKNGYSLLERYISNDSILSIEETVNTLSKVNNAEIMIRLNANTDKYYFNNLLSLLGNWNDDKGKSHTKGAGVDETISQNLEKPVYAFSNAMHMVRNVKKSSYEVNFYTSYTSKPHSLKVSPAIYNFFGDENANKLSALKQDANTKNFISNLRTSYGLKIGNFNLNYALVGNVNITNLNTSLLGETLNGNSIYPADSLKNNLYYNNYRIGIDQGYTYVKNKFKATLFLPLHYYLLTINDKIPGKSTNHNKILFSPSLSVSLDLTHALGVSLNVGYGNSFGDLNSSYTGYIMHGYRSLLRNTIDRLSESRGGNGGISLNYRNPINAWFINAGVNYTKNWRNLLYGYNYHGILSVKNTIDQPTQTNGYRINFRASKGINFVDATIALSSSYGENWSEQLIQNQIVEYQSQNFSISPSIDIKPFSFTSLTYSFSYNRSKNFTKNNPNKFSAIVGTSQNGKLNIYPTKMLTIYFGAEYQYNSAIISGNRYTTFADAGIKYKYKQLDFELECNNIFNSKQYISASYSDISTYYYSYELRPANIVLKIRFKLK